MDAQRDTIERYCALSKLELVELIADPAVSAVKSPLDQREGGARLLRLLQEDQTIGHVVGIKLDRFFRRTVDCLETVRAWSAQGVAFHVIDIGGSQAVNTSSPMGNFFITIMAAVAELEALQIAERVRVGLAEKRRRGEAMGTAPYGKRWVTKSRENPVGYWADDPNEQSIIELIMLEKARGGSVRDIAKKLNAQKISSRGAAWHPTTVARIIKNNTTGGSLDEPAA